MKKALLLFIAALSISGCSAIAAGKIESCIEEHAESVKKFAKITKLVCDTGAIFKSAGVDIPGVEQCEKAMAKANEFLDGPEYAAIAATARCTEDHKIKSVEFFECMDEVDGLTILAEKISGRF